MKRLLIVTFDILRPDEPQQNFAVSYLQAYLRAHEGTEDRLMLDSISINLFKEPNQDYELLIDKIYSKNEEKEYDFIAISAYSWANGLVAPIICGLRKKGFDKTIILGGYQITTGINLINMYPGANYYIVGYAEESLRRILFHADTLISEIIETTPNIKQIPSPYLKGIMKVENGQGRVRVETKRGCPYQCSFCAHKDLRHNKVYYHQLEKTVREFELLHKLNVQKINVLDPTFNHGHNYIDVLNECISLGLKSNLSLQCRFESIKGELGITFLELCSQLDVTLEFGLQSTHPEILQLLNRKNDMDVVESTLIELNKSGIDHEVSLIYGIPGQTLKMFEESINYLQCLGCEKIIAYPLKLIPGTLLWKNRDQWMYKESKKNKYGIPLVVESNTFNEAEWNQMRKLAEELIHDQGLVDTSI